MLYNRNRRKLLFSFVILSISVSTFNRLVLPGFGCKYSFVRSRTSITSCAIMSVFLIWFSKQWKKNKLATANFARMIIVYYHLFHVLKSLIDLGPFGTANLFAQKLRSIKNERRRKTVIIFISKNNPVCDHIISIDCKYLPDWLCLFVSWIPILTWLSAATWAAYCLTASSSLFLSSIVLFWQFFISLLSFCSRSLSFVFFVSRKQQRRQFGIFRDCLIDWLLTEDCLFLFVC